MLHWWKALGSKFAWRLTSAHCLFLPLEITLCVSLVVCCVINLICSIANLSVGNFSNFLQVNAMSKKSVENVLLMFLKTVLKEMSCSESSSMKKCNSTHTHTVLFLYRHNVIRMSLSIQILFASKLFVSTLLYSFCILVHNSTDTNNSTCSFF